jgi:ATP-dependent protease ClpP protease subunit
VIGRIKGILGHIGQSFVDGNGAFHQGTVLLDLIEQVSALPKETAIIEIPINSPGGYVDIGDSMYDYILSLKKQGKQIVTIQAGLVGSIATKLFLAGDRRIADDRYEFFIHNPFASEVTGDQDQLRAAADDLEDVEKNLRKFYSTFTNITDEGLDGLMKIETGLTADQCIRFGFATEKKAVPAFNLVKPKIKKVEDKSFKEQVLALLGIKSEQKAKGVQPKVKAEIPANPTIEAKSLVVNLADGAGAFWVEGEAVVEGAACFLLDADGQPTAEPLGDGEYKLEDGSAITVAAGLITAAMPMEKEEEDPMEEAASAETVYTKDAVDLIVKQEVEKALAGVKTETENIKAEILAIKKSARIGVMPKAAALQNPVKPMAFKTIDQKMAEKREERKQQFKKN